MIDTSPILWVALVTGLGALVVLIWQAVRYFRANPSDRRGPDGPRRGDGVDGPGDSHDGDPGT